MASDFEVTGTEQFLKLSKALKEAGETGLRKKLNKTLRDAGKPLIKQTRQAALDRLPSSGGLAEQVARASQRIQTRTGKDPGIRLVVSKVSGVRASNRGAIRHPVFADGGKTREEWTWVAQEVAAGWFDDVAKEWMVQIVPNVQKALEDMAAEIVKKAGG